MRKLALAAVSFSSAVFLSHYLLPETWLVWCAVLCAAASCLTLLVNKEKRLPLLLIGAGLASGFLWTCVYTAVFYTPARTLSGKTESVSAIVESYPQKTDYGLKLVARVKSAGHPDVKTQLYVYGKAPVMEPGNSIAFTARFRLADAIYGEETDAFKAKGIFLLASPVGDIRLTDTARPLRSLPARVAHAVTEKIEAVFPADTVSFMKALILGDTSGIGGDTVLSAALSATGTSHIISVSGMNVSFLMGLLGILIKNKRLLAAIGIPVVFLFMAVVGFMPPVTRAGIMQIFILTAPLLKRESDDLTSLSVPLVLILLVNPFAAGNIGLQLSFAAMLGILLFTGKIYGALDKHLRKSKVYEYRALRKAARFVFANLATTLGALSLSLPLIALHFGTVSLIAPLANLAVLWAVEVAFIGGIAAVATAFLFAPAGGAVAYIVAWPVRFIIAAITALARAPFAAVYTASPAIIIWLVYLYIILAAFAAYRSAPYRYVFPACLSAAALCLVLVSTSMLSDRTRLSVTALDVGQGQCIVVTSGSFTGVIDCGSSGGRDAGDILTRFLRSRGRTTIDLLALTHYHADHAGGIAEVLARNRVSVLAVPDPKIDGSGLPREIISLASAQGIRLVTVTQDIRAVFGGQTISLYAPLGNDSENERGLTVLCSRDGFDTLITGDMSAAVERLLVSEKRLPDIEVLIVGHHGSKSAASDTLLDAVTPEVAVISVGYNTYGHPSPDTLKKLALRGIVTYRTDQSGNITIIAP